MGRRAGIYAGLRALVALVEDLHWIDQESEAALGALVDVVTSLPVLLVLSHRPGVTHGLGERSHYSRLVLRDLPPDDSALVAAGVLGVDWLPADVRDLVHNKAEGNPFYVEEVTKSLVEMGALTRSNGEYLVEGSLRDVRLPDTIQEIILSRIDRLDREPRETIQLASVIGREFTRQVLQRISESQVELEGMLGGLRSLELIYEKDYFPELSYMFKHALTHEVAYSTLLMDRRRSLHRTVAMAIEELYRDRLAEHYEVLAHHFEEGQVWDRALDYLVKSGHKAAATYAARDALRFFDRALLAADRLPVYPTEVVTLIHEARASLLMATSDDVGAVTVFSDLRRIHRDTGDRKAEGEMTVAQAFAHVLNHEFDKAEAVQAEAYAIAAEIDDDSVKAWAMVTSLMLAVTTGRLSEVAGLADQIRPHAERLHPMLAGMFRMMLPFVNTLQSNHDAAATSAGAPRYIAKGRRLRGQALSALGKHEDSVVELDRAIEVATDDGNPSLIWKALAASGQAQAAAGDAKGGRHAIRRALEVIESIAGDLEDESLRDTFLSSVAVSELQEAAKTGS